MLLKSAVGAGVGTTECHVTEDARTAVEQRFGAGIQCGSGGQDIIDEHYVLTMKSCTVTHSKCLVNVRGTLCGSQPRLRFCRTVSRQHVGQCGHAPVGTECRGEFGGLVESSFALAGRMQRHGNDRCTLPHDVRWPREPSHPHRHFAPHRLPAIVLERAHDPARHGMRDPAHRSHRSDERRERGA